MNTDCLKILKQATKLINSAKGNEIKPGEKDKIPPFYFKFIDLLSCLNEEEINSPLDKQGTTLLFRAVTNNKPLCISYLLDRWKGNFSIAGIKEEGEVNEEIFTLNNLLEKKWAQQFPFFCFLRLGLPRSPASWPSALKIGQNH